MLSLISSRALQKEIWLTFYKNAEKKTEEIQAADIFGQHFVNFSSVANLDQVNAKLGEK